MVYLVIMSKRQTHPRKVLPAANLLIYATQSGLFRPKVGTDVVLSVPCCVLFMAFSYATIEQFKIHKMTQYKQHNAYNCALHSVEREREILLFHLYLVLFFLWVYGCMHESNWVLHKRAIVAIPNSIQIAPNPIPIFSLFVTFHTVNDVPAFAQDMHSAVWLNHSRNITSWRKLFVWGG